MKWQYLEAYSLVKVAGGASKNSYRVLTLDGKEYKLAEGLNFLGQSGWELVAVHSIDEAHGGELSRIRTLTFLYIFKQPLV